MSSDRAYAANLWQCPMPIKNTPAFCGPAKIYDTNGPSVDANAMWCFYIQYLFVVRRARTHKIIKILTENKKNSRNKFRPLTFYGICFIVGKLLANANVSRNCCQACDFQTSIVRCMQLRYFDAQLAARCHQMMAIGDAAWTTQFVRVTSVLAVRVVCVPAAKWKVKIGFFSLIFRHKKLHILHWWVYFRNSNNIFMVNEIAGVLSNYVDILHEKYRRQTFAQPIKYIFAIWISRGMKMDGKIECVDRRCASLTSIEIPMNETHYSKIRIQIAANAFPLLLLSVENNIWDFEKW